MEIIRDVLTTGTIYPHVALTIGSFDGVHLGHRRILDSVIASARAAGGTAAVLTMDPHPREFFTPDRPPNLLTPAGKKLDLLAKAGIDLVYVMTFDHATANMTPEAFVHDVLCARCQVKELVVGHDFRFGRGATGDYDYLEAAGKQCGFATRQIPALFIDGECVSSTRIRECILEGDLDAAAAFLGRPYSLCGQVVPGRGIGVKLGFPTANVLPHHNAVPAHGVYAAAALVNGQRHVAAVNIGIAPTIRHEDITVEAYLLDFAGNIRGAEIEIEFRKRLRPEMKFATTGELIDQIARDVNEIRAIMSGNA